MPAMTDFVQVLWQQLHEIVIRAPGLTTKGKKMIAFLSCVNACI